MPQKKKTKVKNSTEATRKTGNANSEQHPQADVGTGPDSASGKQELVQ